MAACVCCGYRRSNCALTDDSSFQSVTPGAINGHNGVYQEPTPRELTELGSDCRSHSCGRPQIWIRAASTFSPRGRRNALGEWSAKARNSLIMCAWSKNSSAGATTAHASSTRCVCGW